MYPNIWIKKDARKLTGFPAGVRNLDYSNLDTLGQKCLKKQLKQSNLKTN